MSATTRSHPSSPPGASPRLRVMLVDDHELVRQGINVLLTSEPGIEVVAEGSSLAEGMMLTRSTAVDVLVVDVSLGDGSGLDLVRTARGLHPRLGIVVLTMHDDDSTLLEALDSGASALVLKSGTADEVIAAVKHAAMAPDSFTAAGLAGALRRKSKPDRPRLTVRELEVLDRLAAGDSVAGVAKKLYMSESTVKTHIAKLYGKLGANNRASAVMAALRAGLIKS
ncbi:MAG: response regulator transcription factor [Lapillicoccus sp.]